MNTLPTIARYTVNGTLDTAFGRSGLTQLHCAADDELGGDSYAVAVQSDDKIAALTFFAQHRQHRVGFHSLMRIKSSLLPQLLGAPLVTMSAMFHTAAADLAPLDPAGLR